MPAIGKVTLKKIGKDYVVSDESGQAYVLKGYGAHGKRQLDLDPRIDLTKPIYEQVQRLEEKHCRKSKRSSRVDAV